MCLDEKKDTGEMRMIMIIARFQRAVSLITLSDLNRYVVSSPLTR